MTAIAERSTASDAELARQTQAGSASAFEELVYRYEHRVHAFVSQFCRNATDAREITQDTFVKAAQSMSQFDARREFAPWLFTIARRKWIDRQRAAPPPGDAPLPEAVDENHPGELLAQQEDQQQLWRLARQCLKENQFQALWLCYVEDLDVAQIAQVLGKTRVHVKVLLFRARQTLGQQLNPAPTLARAIPLDGTNVPQEQPENSPQFQLRVGSAEKIRSRRDDKTCSSVTDGALVRRAFPLACICIYLCSSVVKL